MNQQDPIRMVNVDDLPWEPHVMGSSIRKVLDTDPSVDSYVHYRFAPPGGAAAKVRRLHLSISETFFFLGGSFNSWEFDSPEDVEGHVVRFRDGTFMDRVPYSVHGTGPDLGTPTGATFLMWTSGGGEFEADTQESIQIPFAGSMPRFNEPYTKPTVIDTTSLAWEDHPSRAGWQWRPISLETAVTPRPVSEIFIPPAWQGSAQSVPARTRAFLFVRAGELAAQIDDRTVSLKEGTYLRWGPGTAIRLVSSSPIGARVLCVGHDLSAM